LPDNRKPLKYGAFPVCRNYTVRAVKRKLVLRAGGLISKNADAAEAVLKTHKDITQELNDILSDKTMDAKTRVTKMSDLAKRCEEQALTHAEDPTLKRSWDLDAASIRTGIRSIQENPDVEFVLEEIPYESLFYNTSVRKRLETPTVFHIPAVEMPFPDEAVLSKVQLETKYMDMDGRYQKLQSLLEAEDIGSDRWCEAATALKREYDIAKQTCLVATKNPSESLSERAGLIYPVLVAQKQVSSDALDAVYSRKMESRSAFAVTLEKSLLGEAALEGADSYTRLSGIIAQIGQFSQREVRSKAALRSFLDNELNAQEVLTYLPGLSSGVDESSLLGALYQRYQKSLINLYDTFRLRSDSPLKHTMLAKHIKNTLDLEAKFRQAAERLLKGGDEKLNQLSSREVAVFLQADDLRTIDSLLNRCTIDNIEDYSHSIAIDLKTCKDAVAKYFKNGILSKEEKEQFETVIKLLDAKRAALVVQSRTARSAWILDHPQTWILENNLTIKNTKNDWISATPYVATEFTKPGDKNPLSGYVEEMTDIKTLTNYIGENLWVYTNSALYAQHKRLDSFISLQELREKLVAKVKELTKAFTAKNSQVVSFKNVIKEITPQKDMEKTVEFSGLVREKLQIDIKTKPLTEAANIHEDVAYLNALNQELQEKILDAPWRDLSPSEALALGKEAQATATRFMTGGENILVKSRNRLATLFGYTDENGMIQLSGEANMSFPEFLESLLEEERFSDTLKEGIRELIPDVKDTEAYIMAIRNLAATYRRIQVRFANVAADGVADDTLKKTAQGMGTLPKLLGVAGVLAAYEAISTAESQASEEEIEALLDVMQLEETLHEVKVSVPEVGLVVGNMSRVWRAFMHMESYGAHKTHSFSLDPIVTMEGSVVNFSGKPVKGADIRVELNIGNEAIILSDIQSDATGAFGVQLPQGLLFADSLKVSVTKGEVPAAVKERVAVKFHGGYSVGEFVLAEEEIAAIEGKVVNSKGEPVKGATIHLSVKEHGKTQAFTGISREDGTYRIVIPRGSLKGTEGDFYADVLRISASAEGHPKSEVQEYKDFYLSGASTLGTLHTHTLADLVLKDSTIVQLQVVDETGEGIGNARVSYTARENLYPYKEYVKYIEDFTDSKGYVKLNLSNFMDNNPWIDVSRSILRIYASGMCDYEKDYKIKENEINDLGQIQLKKVTASPTPVPTLEVTATPTRKPTSTPTPTVKPTTTPTPAATPTPTAMPSVTPSPSPTPAPSVTPTATPTVLPTVSPTVSPSVRPITSPAA